MEKLHYTKPFLFNQVTTGIIIPNISDRGVIRGVRLQRVGSHASAIVKFKIYNHPAAVALPSLVGDPLASIAAAAPELFLVTAELSVGASEASLITLNLNQPYVNRAYSSGQVTRELYLKPDTSAPAQQWYLGLDIVEGAL